MNFLPPILEPLQPAYEDVSIFRQLWNQLTFHQTPQRFKLAADWTIPFPGEKTTILIPKGFITDFASIPRPLWPWIAPGGPLYVWAIVHDFAYQFGFLWDYGTTQVFAGKGHQFFDAMLRDGTIRDTGCRLEAEEAYVALIAFGGITWNKYRALGPSAFYTNSLGLPGMTLKGPRL